eukprot:7573298-Pyramimonas_sp.AAC.1
MGPLLEPSGGPPRALQGLLSWSSKRRPGQGGGAPDGASGGRTLAIVVNATSLPRRPCNCCGQGRQGNFPDAPPPALVGGPASTEIP